MHREPGEPPPGEGINDPALGGGAGRVHPPTRIRFEGLHGKVRIRTVCSHPLPRSALPKDPVAHPESGETHVTGDLTENRHEKGEIREEDGGLYPSSVDLVGACEADVDCVKRAEEGGPSPWMNCAG